MGCKVLRERVWHGDGTDREKNIKNDSEHNQWYLGKIIQV
jgi:hypothetical protein